MSKNYAELEKRHASPEQKVQAENKKSESAQKEWESLTILGTTDYLKRKKVDALYGARIGVDEGGMYLAIPMRDLSGKLWGIQRIADAPRENWMGHDKFIEPDTKMKGTCHLIGTPKGKLFLAEGYATGASIHMATGEAVLVCFNCWNMRDLAPEARLYYPDQEIIIAADNDTWTTNQKGEPWNPGLQAAHQAAQKARCRVITPEFRDTSSHPTDFNDLHCLEGIATVREQLLRDVVRGAGTTPIQDNLELATPVIGKSGKPIKMPDRLVVEQLINHFGTDLCKQGRDLFVYTGTHWRLLTPGEEDIIKVKHIQDAFLGMADWRDITRCFNHFVAALPESPRDMFEPRRWCVNFLNGTLYVNGNNLVFGPHKREDFLINCIPLDYSAEEKENAEFTAMMERIFEGDPDKEDKVLAIMEMYGSCLMPTFPHIFMLHSSQGGTGKSTVIQLAARMISKENMCSVEPCDFKSFGMETMAGKLVNIDADITIHEPIRDSVIKKIVDAMPVRLQRKGKKDLMVPLPLLHIFGGNGVPPTLEGISKAHDRRWTFIEFNNVFATSQHNFKFVDKVWDAGPSGVLSFAVRGLKRLLEREGAFTQPESGRKEIQEWQLRSDLVGSFFKAVNGGEIYSSNQSLAIREGVQIERAKLYEEFRKWCDESGVRCNVSRIAFLKRLGGTLFMTGRVKKVNGVHYLEGIGWVDRSGTMC